MFLDYSGYEALTEINSSFGKYVLLLHQFESCQRLKDRLQMLKDLGKEFSIFEGLRVGDFKESKSMVHRFYTMVISLKQIMEIGPLIRRSPAVLIVEFGTSIEDCLDELDPLHPLNTAYIFIYKQWAYYHQYYVIEKIKKVIINMAPVEEDDWSILHKVIYSDGFPERRYKNKKYLGDIYIPQPFMKSKKITTISKFSQISKISNVKVYRFHTTVVSDPSKLSKNNLKVQELGDKDFPNLIWTLEPENFYVDMKPYKEHRERKRQREEAARLKLLEQEKGSIILEEKNERNGNEIKVLPGLKNIMKTPLANKVVNIFSNYAAAVTGYTQAIETDVNDINGSTQQKDGDIPELSNGKLAQQSRSQIQAGPKTQTNNSPLQAEFRNNDENNISWNTTMQDIDPIYMNEKCIRVWRKEQQMLGLERARTFDTRLQKDPIAANNEKFGKPGNNPKGRAKSQRIKIKTSNTASTIINKDELTVNSHRIETHGLVREYFKAKFSISSKGSKRGEKTGQQYTYITKYDKNNINGINISSKDIQATVLTNLTDIHFRDVMTVKFKGFKAKFSEFKIIT
ncbi:hypothetical protein GRS66_009088 [Saccharomyces pastorianus]|uniref:Uncharacterized protein n=1 Tax=Saccharomyces pastorianus TaxID=27292 RepID=A0A6C1EBP7_SACPS|nr:hypothetical protein GRS66_009088 [Saccharomyces pastorianus]